MKKIWCICFLMGMSLCGAWAQRNKNKEQAETPPLEVVKPAALASDSLGKIRRPLPPEDLARQKVFHNMEEALIIPDSVYLMDFPQFCCSELPKDMEKLIHLQSLFMGSSGLVVLDARVGTFQNLQILDLKYNNLEDLPSALANLKNLRSLNLQKTGFAKFRPSSGNCPASRN
ncbi:MAG: leucine-rich repeat domain-containing protein [Microscillaceae bacterium]|nr:leucine-rich repeat domain-containing protein [Microscillaceae bacterium]